MKILVEANNKDLSNYIGCCDGIIVGLKDFSVMNVTTFSIEEIISLTKDKFPLELFVKLDKHIFNGEISKLKDMLLQLDKLPIQGVFFYDLSLLQLRDELQLSLPFVWSQTHMVTNYRTCNYYYERGVSYALLSKEITLDEILEIASKSDIQTMVEVVCKPSVAFSRRKLVSNYYEDLKKQGTSFLQILEKITNKKYLVKEEDSGTGFLLDEIMNGTCVIGDLYRGGVCYIILREDGVESFMELVQDTKKYIDGKCLDSTYVLKYQKLGKNTGFFFKKSVYRVKRK